MRSSPIDLANGSRHPGRLLGKAWDFATASASAPSEASRNPEIVRDILDRVRRAARVDTPVLILGAPGSGQPWIAQAIHRHSSRGSGPLVSVHIAALPQVLVEGELFGRRRPPGATPAPSRPSRFEAAHGGSVFLDEVSDLPPTVQAKLLRVLEHHCITPAGSNQDKPVDVRVIAAASGDLEAMVDSGQFREDLYYDLTVLTVCLPPALNDHHHEPPPWIWDVLEGLAEDERQASTGPWPSPAGAPPGGESEVEGSSTAPVQTLADLEQSAVARALEQHRGNRTRAAMSLGISVRTLQRKLKKWRELT